MDDYRYLVVLAGCLVAALPLEWLLRARVVRRPRRWIASLVPAAVGFVALDALVIATGLRSFVDRHLTGLTLRDLVPVEDLALVVVVPTAALLVYEGVGEVLARVRGDDVVPGEPETAAGGRRA